MPEIKDFIARCLQLASLSLGKVSPSPLQGWVLVNNHWQIVSEGWLPERPILSNSVFYDNSTPQNRKGSYLFLNHPAGILSEHAKLLQDHPIQQLFVAAKLADADRKLLQQTGISITDALAEEEEDCINRRWYTFTSRHRPYIILKWAETSDGFVARKNFDSKWISNARSRQLVHKWRSEEDAILVGTNTALYDNPRLNVRNWSGRNPLRIVIDKHLRLDNKLLLFDGSQPTLCYNYSLNQKDKLTEWVQVDPSFDDLSFFGWLLHDLYLRNIQSLIIEGGSQLLHFLIAHQLWDEARVFVSPSVFGDGIAAPGKQAKFLDASSTIEQDKLNIYKNVNH